MMQSKLNRGFFPSMSQSSRQAGMTLMEIIIVVALLGSLMTFLISQLSNTSEQAKVDQAKIGMGVISQSLRMYQVHNGRYPTTEQGLESLLRNPGDSKKWRGPYIEENKLNDPWDVPFKYEAKGRDYEIISSGIDQNFGTEDDIYYPERDGSAQPTN